MRDDESDALRARLLERVGEPMSTAGPSLAPDPVNLAMIRHWVDTLDDRNPIYLDDGLAPPAMLQVWTMGRPRIAGIAARGGAADEVDADSPVAVLADAGFGATLATNSELEFARYLRVGDRLESTSALEAISELKGTALGVGYFVTWLTTFRTSAGEEVGRQRFRIFKFDPTRTAADLPPRRHQSSERRTTDETRPQMHAAALPALDLDVTATVIVAGALASRDFMPVHHDRDFAQAQGAPDIFMNILTTNGYVARYVTDWAGPDARLRRIAIRLGGPAIPGLVLRFTGRVTDEQQHGADQVLEVTMRAANDLGDHATGTVGLTLP